METYNIDEIKKELIALHTTLNGKEKTKIADLENLNPVTIEKYLKGEIATPAIAVAIINRGRQMISVPGRKPKKIKNAKSKRKQVRPASH